MCFLSALFLHFAIAFLHRRRPALDLFCLSGGAVVHNLRMGVLYHAFDVLHVVFHHTLEGSHPRGVGIDASSAELLEGDAQIAVDDVFVLLVHLAQQRLVIGFCVEFGRHHVKRHVALPAHTVLLVGEVQFEHAGLVQKVQFSRERLVFPSVQCFVQEETLLNVPAHMPNFWQSRKQAGN